VLGTTAAASQTTKMELHEASFKVPLCEI